MWTVKDGTAGTPDKKKPSWFAYQKAGTASEDDGLSFALPIIGINKWSQAFNTLDGTVMPYTITFNISKTGTALNNMQVYFNGEVHNTINGKAVFYNVASTNIKRSYTIMESGRVIYNDGNIEINKNQTIQVKVK